MCLACAIPVRGQVVGAECLSVVVEDAPVQVAAPPAGPPRGDRFALAGGILVSIVSVFPWARGEVAAGFGDAWRVRWSLLAVAAGVAAMLAVVIGRRRAIDPSVMAGVYLVLGAAVALGAILHAVRPPPLSNVAATYPWRFALVGAASILVGAAVNLTDVARSRRPVAVT